MRPYLRKLFLSLWSVVLLTYPLSFGEFAAGGQIPAQISQTYIVDRLTDANPASGGQGTGLTGDLRYALTQAQTGDHISFSVTGTINLSSFLPMLTRNISIDGPGADILTVDGAGGSVFAIGSGATVMISGLTITGGTGNGSGIFNAGTLTLNKVTVSGNQAGDPTNGGGTGAGIWNYSSGKLTINSSTISGNRALGNSSYNPSRGGGIANYGILSLENSTVSGNSVSEGSGGGISNTLTTSILQVNNSTISGNAATGAAGLGGGLYNLGTINISNTILAGNSNQDVHGALTSQGHNLVGNTSGGSGFRPDLGDLLNVNPSLGPLQSNGGPTFTHGLLAVSPAIQAGDDTRCPATDQRGATRPQGIHCDIGSYEYQGIIALRVLSSLRAGQNPASASSVAFTVTFSEAVTGVNTGDFALTTTGVTGASIAAVSGSGTTYTVTINTGSASGTIRLDIVDDDSIRNNSNNPLGGTGAANGNFSAGETYTILKYYNPADKWTNSFDLSHGWTVNDYVRTVGDVNGDGKADLIGFGLDGVYVALSTGTGFSPISRWTTSFDLSHGWTVAQFVRTVGDVDGDGRDDLVGFGQDGVYVALALNPGPGFSAISRWTTSFDLSHGWTVAQFVRSVGDISGDGRDDLVGFGQDGVYVATSTGSSFSPISRWTTSFDLSHGWTVAQYARTVGDVSGDGKADLVGFGQDGVYVARSNGSSFSPISRWTQSFDLSHGWTVSQYVRTVGDVNGDGRADLVGFGLDGVYAALSTGSGFSPISLRTIDFSYAGQGWTVSQHVRTVGDVNGDGKADLIGFGIDGVYVATAK